MTFASPSAVCGACWYSMRFMIAERQDESIAAPWTSFYAAIQVVRHAAELVRPPHRRVPLSRQPTAGPSPLAVVGDRMPARHHLGSLG